MKASDYRRDFSAYRAARERAAYEFYAGRSARLDLAPLRDRYADLWAREAVADLEHERDATPAGFETERAALSSLLGAARLGYAERRAAEVSDELSRCESSARVDWGGERYGAEDVPALLASEPDAARRRELAARWLDSLSACDDLRAARIESLRGASRELGFDDFGALRSGATRTDVGQLAAEADLFLEITAAPYSSRLARWAALNLPPQFARNPDRADAFSLARLARLDEYFPARDAPAAFEAVTGGLGIRAGRQNKLAGEESARAGSGGATCFAPSPPEDVRLVFAPRAGADFYQRFFQAAARARQLAWVSPELAARYPEFVRGPDASVPAGFALLFRHLFTDPVWVERHLGTASNVARGIAAACALTELHDARRACALALDWLELQRAAGARTEAAAEAYAERLTEATGFRQPAALRLSDALGEGMNAAEDVRARLFAASVGEYLRTRHGTRWWVSRAAGDELIDVWTTGSRHTAEELAALLGAPRPDAELLSNSLTMIDGE
ncbi:MAG TPA: hypothetical protein VK421_16830 [Pyrinomonadaceae bacterium]|nr:hypothetical protein [Pyrinomonadaceae bacterium]